MQIENYKAIGKGCVIGSFEIVIPQWQMSIRGCTLFIKGVQKWVSLPSRKFENDEGKTCYFPFIKFEESAHGRFQEKVLEALKPYMEKAAPQQDDIQDLPF